MDSDQIYDIAKEFQIKSFDTNVVVFKQVKHFVNIQRLKYLGRAS